MILPDLINPAFSSSSSKSMIIGLVQELRRIARRTIIVIVTCSFILIGYNDSCNCRDEAVARHGQLHPVRHWLTIPKQLPNLLLSAEFCHNQTDGQK